MAKAGAGSIVRLRLIAGALAFFLLMFAARLVYVQAIQGPELAQQALDARLRTYVIEAPRGQILDATGQVLAQSSERVNIGVNQLEVARFVHEVDGEVVGTGAAAAADLLAPILGVDEAELGGMMVGSSTFVYLAKGLTPTEWREIRALGIDGIGPEWVSDREYPNGNTAGNVLGFVGVDDVGLAGLEQTFNSVLTGVDGAETVEIGVGGQVIPTGTNETVPSQPGSTLNVTIDRDLQFLAQQLVDETTARYSAQWAGVAMVEIGTGRVIVLADSGAVDPNDPGLTNAADRGARSVSAPYEPGSTGKLLTIAAAVDQGVVDPSTVFFIPSRETIDGQVFNDSTPHPDYDMTLTGILATSSNIGTVHVGNLLTDEERYQYMLDFGFGTPTGIGLPGEEPGLLSLPENWDGRTRMTTMFGQGYAITLLQNASMVATIGNGGTYVAPYLVESIEAADGTVTVPDRAEDRQVISPEAAQTMIDMMEGVVQEGGTAPRAAIPNYRVAGKTGTAQTADASGALTQVVANFVGIVPADAPRFAVAVVVYKPQSGFYGGTVAAPIFQQLSQAALLSYGVPPSQGEPAALPWLADGSLTIP